MNPLIAKQVQRQKDELERWVQRRNAGIPLPEEVECILDVAYLPDGSSRHRMDVYRPRNVEGPLPVVVNFHGGGLLMGCKEANRQACGQLAQWGFLVFCPEYSLAPEVRVFEQLEEVCAAMDAVDGMLESYGGDKAHVYLVGDSAGAYLVAYAAAMQRSASLAEAAGVTPSALPVRAMGLISGMFYTRRLDSIGLFLTASFYGKGWRRHPFRPYMDPEHPAVAGNLPPSCLITSPQDPLRRYTLDFYQALREQGTQCVLMQLPDSRQLGHACCALTPELQPCRNANREMAAFLRRY